MFKSGDTAQQRLYQKSASLMQLVSGCSFKEAFPPFARGFVAVQPGTMHPLPRASLQLMFTKESFLSPGRNHCNCGNMATESLEG